MTKGHESPSSKNILNPQRSNRNQSDANLGNLASESGMPDHRFPRLIGAAALVESFVFLRDGGG
jgi:hypothetical protein